MAETRTSAYLISTQYHLLLAAAVAAYLDGNEDKHLLISSHFRDTRRMADALRGWKRNPFDSITVVNERWGSEGVLNKVSTIRKGLGTIRGFMDAHPGALDAYVFNIEQPEGQFLAYTNHLAKGKNVYVEDGIDAYTTRSFHEPLPAKLLKKLLYGHWYRRVDTQVEYPYFNEIMVLRPELVGAKHAKARLRRIPNDVFSKLDRDGLIGRILDEYGVKNLECEAIVLVPSSKQAEVMGYGKTVDAYSHLLDALARKKIKTVVKYHPREEKGDFLHAARRGMTIIQPSVTSEMLFLRWKGKKRIAIGDTTTALCTCKLIVPDSTALSIVGAMGYEAKKFEVIFRKWGVLCPKSINEAVGLITGRG